MFDWFLTPASCVFSTGVLQTDHEDETQRPEEASDGEVSGRGGAGLRWSC